MKFFDAHPELFSKLQEEFKTAELQIKDTEIRFPASGLATPAINQLRYVAQHLLETCEVTDSAKQIELLHEMISHCRRGTFDAAEVAVLGYLEAIKGFREDFKDVIVTEAILDWVALLAKVEKIRQHVTTIDRTKRHEAAEQFRLYVQSLAEINGIADAGTEELKKLRQVRESKLLQEQRAHETKSLAEKRTADVARFRWILTIMLSSLALVVAIVKLFSN